MGAADWSSPDHYRTAVTRQSANALDADRYAVSTEWEGSATVKLEAPHEFILRPSGRKIGFVSHFSIQPGAGALSGVRKSFDASREKWAKFWSSGKSSICPLRS